MVSRYGVKVRKAVNAVKKLKKQKYECPRCGKKNLKRAGFALWECSSCGHKMAGGAYSPTTEAGVSAKKIVSSIKTN